MIKLDFDLWHRPKAALEGQLNLTKKYWTIPNRIVSNACAVYSLNWQPEQRWLSIARIMSYIVCFGCCSGGGSVRELTTYLVRYHSNSGKQRNRCVHMILCSKTAPSLAKNRKYRNKTRFFRMSHRLFSTTFVATTLSSIKSLPLSGKSPKPHTQHRFLLFLPRIRRETELVLAGICGNFPLYRDYSPHMTKINISLTLTLNGSWQSL